MTDFLLKFFGISATDAANVSRWSVAFYGLNPLYVFLAAVVLGVAVVWMYRRAASDVSPLRRYALAVLRIVFLVLILIMLLRPVLSVTLQSSVRRTVVMLFDTSASMNEVKDQRSDQNDLKRVALARNILDPGKGLSQPLSALSGLTQVPRLDLLKAVLKNPRLNLLPSLAKNYDLAAYTFDRTLTEIPAASYKANSELAEEKPAEGQGGVLPALNAAWVGKLQASGAYTAIGDAVQEVISRKRGQPLAGIVLVTDGASNSGVLPLDAAASASREKVPLYVYGVGITSPRDIVVSTIFAQEVAFAKDEVPITVRVRSMGMAGETARMMVHMGEEKTEKEVTFNADGEQLVTVLLTPKFKGEFDIRAYIPPRDDEVVKDNNAATQRIRVIDGKIKVLFIEQFPRWEYKYVQAVLMRDRRVEARFILLEGDASIARGESTPYLLEFPRRKEDLFKYDVVILGDVDPKSFSPAQLDAINEFVSKFGGSMILLAGKRHSPNDYRQTPIEKMLPVELESMVDTALSPGASKPLKLELTPAGKAANMLRLEQRELDSIARWAQLPPIYWACKVARAKPAAEVLLVDPDPVKSSRYGKMPVLAVHQYGLGQVLYVGTDNFWRWRKNAGDRYHAALWGQMVQRMALPHLLGASKRTQLTSDQKSYTTGSKVTIFARLYTEGFEPMNDPTVRGFYQDSTVSAVAREAGLRPIPDRPGMYRGELIAPSPGNYVFTVEHDKSSKLEFSVSDPKQELAEAAMNEALLRQMAEASGGAFFREEDLYTLPIKIGAKTERLESTLEVELWSSPFYFLLMLLVVTAEWIGRKMVQLK